MEILKDTLSQKRKGESFWKIGAFYAAKSSRKGGKYARYVKQIFWKDLPKESKGEAGKGIRLPNFLWG